MKIPFGRMESISSPVAVACPLGRPAALCAENKRDPFALTVFALFSDVVSLAQERSMGMISEFKEFAMRGNVIDLAVGVVIGGAFGKIVTALVDQIIMPPIGMLTGGIDFSELKWVLKPADASNPAHKVAEVAIQYGAFINTLIQFVIIAFAIFLMVKTINRLSRKQEAAAPVAPPPTPEDVLLLREIRDSLKKGSE
jgi:large conductance mechanosensitive channel